MVIAGLRSLSELMLLEIYTNSMQSKLLEHLIFNIITEMFVRNVSQIYVAWIIRFISIYMPHVLLDKIININVVSMKVCITMENQNLQTEITCPRAKYLIQHIVSSFNVALYQKFAIFY